MIIGCLTLEIYLPYCHSLKDKRKRLKSLKDRLKTRYNVAFAELDYQNKWQRSSLGVVSLNSRQIILEKMFNQILKDIEDHIDGEILSRQIDFF